MLQTGDTVRLDGTNLFGRVVAVDDGPDRRFQDSPVIWGLVDFPGGREWKPLTELIPCSTRQKKDVKYYQWKP